MVEHAPMDPFQMIEEHTHADFSRGSRITPTSFNFDDIAMEIDKNEEEEESSTTSSIAMNTFVTEDDEEFYNEDEKGHTVERMTTVEAPNTEDEMGFKRFPCKARNVCESHTSKSAYIELPPDAIHGLQLFCSHPECSGTGRAFRWCNVCEVIVAKRNFVKRHSHGLLRTKQIRSSSKKKKKVTAKPPTTNSLSSAEAPVTKGGSCSPPEIPLQPAQNKMPVPQGAPPSSLLDAGGSMPLSTPPLPPPRSTDSSTRDPPPTPSRGVFAQDEEEDASIQAIGNLTGWNEADIDSIFD
jgi:hypothetical protein